MLSLQHKSNQQTPLIVETSDIFRRDVSPKLDPKKRSKLGQFFTPATIARFMASLFNKTKDGSIRLLDPGAGVGSLTAAFVEEFTQYKWSKANEIEIMTYEIESIISDYLKSTLKECQKLCENKRIACTINNYNEDFILDTTRYFAQDIFSKSTLPDAKFTHAILNPPYKKILSTSEHRRALRKIGIETSNLYTAFLAITIKLLKKRGELVAIIPRSFCNGPYFKPFRKMLLSEMCIKHIHVFESRTHAFKEDEVLQENIIFHAVKGLNQGEVKITSSMGGEFFREEKTCEIITSDMTQRVIPFDKVVKPNDHEQVIHIAISEFEQQIIDRISVFNCTLEDLGIEVSTGPVVDFRMNFDTRKDPEEGTVPLLFPVHFDNGGITWPKESKKPNAINVSEFSRKWLWPNKGHYVITRRFSSKEEKRRIVATVYDSSLPGELIGFENHLNVFHKTKQGMPGDIAKGLYIYLNCTLVDKYFRQFSGHTQVNSSDLRMLLYPSTEVLENLSLKAGNKQLNQEDIDSLINEEIDKMADVKAIDPSQVQKKIDDALFIVKALGMPRGQHNDRSALTLLAVLNLTPDKTWDESGSPLIGITPIMEFCRENYGKEYAPNTRETFRRQTMHQFVDAGIALYNPDKPDRPVNSPKACYQISPEALEVILVYGTADWDEKLKQFLKMRDTLAQRYAKERDMQMIPVTVAKGEEINLTPGVHSQLIKDIIVEFAPRFAPGSEVIYVGDTGDKIGYFQKKRLAALGVKVDKHGKMPDVVLYFPEKDWLLLIESVTSHGPVDSKRHHELIKLFEGATPGLVYVTAFPDRATMGKYLADLSWETDVWVAEAPTHMIHFDGKRFLGPYND
ncbi:BsuBI/PstI family type II restriction endonuclease [Thermodesulfobacteriota bacterium]